MSRKDDMRPHARKCQSFVTSNGAFQQSTSVPSPLPGGHPLVTHADGWNSDHRRALLIMFPKAHSECAVHPPATSSLQVPARPFSRLSPARMPVRMPARDASVVIASITETLRFPGRAGVLAVGGRRRPSEAVGGRNDRVSGCSDAGCRPLADPPPISGWSAIGRSMTC